MHRPHPGRFLLAGFLAATSLAFAGVDLPRIRWNDVAGGEADEGQPQRIDILAETATTAP